METGKEVVKININNIIPNRFQPRISFDEQALEELSNSIKMYGILQPLILRPLGDKYEIIAGERRYKAATMAGLTEVPAILVNLDDQTSAELAIIENIQRKDLTAIEEAKSYKKLLDLGNYTQDQLANKMGKKQSTIANKLRLLNLIPEAQDALMNNLISERHARSLLQLKDNPEIQKEILNRITNERLTVKDTDEAIKNIIGGNNMNENITTPQMSNNQLNNNAPDFNNYNMPNNVNVPNMDMNNSMEFNNNNLQQDNNGISNFNINNIAPNNVQPQINNQEPSFDIPNLNTDTFNLSELSDPNLNIPSTPQNIQTQPQDFNSVTNSQPINNNNIIDNPQPEMDIPNFDSLLQVEEEKSVIEPVDETPKPQFDRATPPTNVYFPPLDKEPANMSFANPYETANLQTNNNSTNNITDAITQIKETIKKLEENGHKLTTIESDLGETYQIIINIKKETTPTM